MLKREKNSKYVRKLIDQHIRNDYMIKISDDTTIDATIHKRHSWLKNHLTKIDENYAQFINTTNVLIS